MDISPKDRLIVALDVNTASEALALAGQLADIVGMFKIGSQLFTACGPDIVREIVRRGGRVFLDLKYHDIPNTVAHAAVEATRLGVAMLDVHTSGGREMIETTVAAVDEICSAEAIPRPLIVGITVLTSLDQTLIHEVGFAGDVPSTVARLAALAAGCGLDGVVASPLEAAEIRRRNATRRLKVVTPGIRPGSDVIDDQRRTMTPADAIAAGSDYLVVGRPIIASKEPRSVAAAIVREIERSIART